MNVPNDLGACQIQQADLLRQTADLNREVAELKEELQPHRSKEKHLAECYEAIVARLDPAESAFTRPSFAILAADLGFELREFLLVVLRLEDAGLIHADYDHSKLSEITQTITIKKR